MKVIKKIPNLNSWLHDHLPDGVELEKHSHGEYGNELNFVEADQESRPLLNVLRAVDFLEIFNRKRIFRVAEETNYHKIGPRIELYDARFLEPLRDKISIFEETFGIKIDVTLMDRSQSKFWY